MGCPVAPSARREAVTWLAGHAVGLEYADGAQHFAPPPADGDAAQGGAGEAAGADDALTGGASRQNAVAACACAALQATRRHRLSLAVLRSARVFDADVAPVAVDEPALWAHVRSCAAALRGGGEGGADAGGPCTQAAALAAAAAQLAWLAALPPDERVRPSRSASILAQGPHIARVPTCDAQARAAAAAAAAADAPGSFPTGFAAPRPALARPAALLRACHVARLRALQSRADAALVAAQEATADPRTDTKLGRVGR